MGRTIKRKNSNSFAKVSKYLPVFIILLSLTIILGSTFAYFTDKVERTSDLTFSKVELSSETTTGINGTIKDVIPGTPLVNGALKFSKSIDSEAIYVRAKISFTLPNEYKDDNDMKEMVDLLRSATDFNIVSEEQNGAVWSAKSGNYFYLLNSMDASKLTRVDTIDTYTLSNEIVVPRDLKNLLDNAQYMKSINFHVAFEAIQADNVSDVLSETKEVFNTLFPESESEKSTIKVTLKGFDLTSTLKVLELEKGEIFNELNVDIPLDANNEPTHVIDGWYTDSEYSNKYEFGNVLEESVTLYPLVYEVSQGLKFTYLSSSDSYSVAKGTCEDTNIVVPNTYMGKPVTQVASSGFSGVSMLKNIRLPNTINIIDSFAFYNCTALELTSLPNDLTRIEYCAFHGCTNLALTSLPSRIKYIGGSAFYKCANLTLTSLPSGITTIESSAFQSCTNLSLESLPDGITKIGNSSFWGCERLALTELPSSVTSIGNYGFNFCPSLALTSLPVNLTTIGSSAFSSCKNITLTSLPNGITSIESDTFTNCNSLALTSLPSGVTSIGSSAFSGCTNLALTELPSGITSIGRSAFSSCTNLVLTELPSAITKIEDYTFSYCTNLALESLPSGVTYIGTYAFRLCGNIKLTTLPSGITYIGTYAFNCCSGITLTSLPNELTYIGDNAFSGCDKLAFTALPVGVTSIGNYAFSGCDKLALICLPGDVASIGSYVFNVCNNLNYILCETEEVASLVQGKGVDNKYIYTMQANGYENGTPETAVMINDEVTIYTATIDGYKWVRTSDNKYFKCIA